MNEMVPAVIDLRKCKKGDRLISKHGLVLTYDGPSRSTEYPHLVLYPDGSGGTRTHNGQVCIHKRLPTDHDVIFVLPPDQTATVKALKSVVRKLKHAAGIVLDTLGEEETHCMSEECTEETPCSFCQDINAAREEWEKAEKAADKAMRMR